MPATAPPCPLCHDGQLRPRMTYWLYGSPVVLGYFLLVPGVVGTFTAAVRLAFELNAPNSGTRDALASLGLFLIVAMFGYLLTLRRRVLCCSKCEAIFPAA
jgi:hypothetical protein